MREIGQGARISRLEAVIRKALARNGEHHVYVARRGGAAPFRVVYGCGVIGDEPHRPNAQSPPACRPAPARITEVIVAHELVHRREPHHDQHFWRRLERTISDYAARKSWLAQHGARYTL